jgi:shikimate kinase
MAQRHLILCGLPGAGKTTVGRIVAQQLGVGLVDFDQVLVRKHGMPIAQIFGLHGEQKFREMENQIAENALAGPPSVISPGGGWLVQPGNYEKARAVDPFIIYLKVLPSVASGRAGGDGTRPMLVGDDPIARMRQLTVEREPTYAKADATIANDNPKTAEQAAAEVVKLARTSAGWP